jgi:hypothetical protein
MIVLCQPHPGDSGEGRSAGCGTRDGACRERQRGPGSPGWLAGRFLGSPPWPHSLYLARPDHSVIAYASLPPHGGGPAGTPTTVRVIVTRGMPGWQITLIALGAALLAAIAAVPADRARMARKADATTA